MCLDSAYSCVTFESSGKDPMSSQKKKVTPSFFAHAVLKTSRFEEMVKYWKTLLNADIAHQDAMFCFMTYDDEHHRLAIVSVPGLKDNQGQTAGLDHLAYTYASMDDLISTYERLKVAGIEPGWCINHGPTLSLYYTDPDGSRAELQIDLFSNSDQANEFIASDAFVENPIGIKFEPEVLFGRYQSGETLEALTVRRPLRQGESFFDHLNS